jgi:ferredoxin
VAGNPGSRTGRDGLFRHVPRIDEARCSGCDACVRVCAHGALVLDPGNGAPAYRVDPARCTGCHLCADECAERAVTVVEMATCDRREIRLDERRCTRCGAPFHLPAAQTADFGLCPICRKTDHHRKLFQVRP